MRSIATNALLQLVLLGTLTSTASLEARWTPAKDAGSARFSKRYRDAAGEDYKRWMDPDEDSSTWMPSWMPSVLPQTRTGWAFALVAAAVVYVVYVINTEDTGGAARTFGSGGATLGGGQQQQGAASATEAARAAFLRREQERAAGRKTS